MSEQLHQAAARIESLLAASAAGGPGAQARAEDLVACVTNLYGDGLRRLLEVLDDAGALSPATLDAIADDELVAGLLLVHDLHPYDVRLASAARSTRCAPTWVRTAVTSSWPGSTRTQTDWWCGCACWAAATGARRRR